MITSGIRVNQRLIVFALAWLVALIFVGATPVAPPPPDDQRSLDQVSALFRRSREAIDTVQCDYLFELNGIRRHCRYARDGDRFRHGSVDIAPNGSIGVAREVAWDGQRAYQRARYGMMNRSTDRNRAMPACPDPEDELLNVVAIVFGFTADTDHLSLRFQGATAGIEDGRAFKDLRFVSVTNGWTLVTRHSAEVGYWPIHAKVTYADGTTRSELTDVRYARLEPDGNTVFYPVHFRWRAWVPGEHMDSPTNDTRVEVNEATLRVNTPILPAHFALNPWPSEEVYDWEADRSTPPADPAWSPIGKVEFPWDKFAPHAEQIIAKQRELSRAGGSAPPAAADAAATHASARPRDLGLGESDGYVNWPMVAGIVVLGSGAYLLYRQRCRARPRAGRHA